MRAQVFGARHHRLARLHPDISESLQYVVDSRIVQMAQFDPWIEHFRM
jgi:hypothetical protein